MTLVDLLDDLRRRGVVLAAEGDRLRFSPRAAVPAELVAALREHKPAILARLRTSAGDPPEPAALDLDVYLAEHGCYPPEGIGGPGFIDRWLAEQEAADWPALALAADLIPFDELPLPVDRGYNGDPRGPVAQNAPGCDANQRDDPEHVRGERPSQMQLRGFGGA